MGTGQRLAVTFALATTAVILGTSTPAHGAVDRPHSLAFKVGYHWYPQSSYFDVSEENFIGGEQDFSGQSFEIFDYRYQWPSRWSVDISPVGLYYQEFVPTQTTQQSIFLHTMTITPLYRLAGSDAIGSWQLYSGVGLGRYNANIRFDFSTGGSQEYHTYTLGYLALIGTEYRYNEYTGFLLEAEYSRARIRFGSELGNLEIDVGGLTIWAGARLHF